MIDVELIRSAHADIPSEFRDSPQFVSERLSELLGTPVIVKVESVNPIGSFKGRGTWLAVQRLVAAGEVSGERGIIVASAGNFGQGVAYAGRARGVPVTVHASAAANPTKLDAMRRLGAEVRLADGDFDSAREAAAADAVTRGWTLLVDGQDPLTAVGAGTIALELTGGVKAGALPALAVAAIPVGNGALIAGMGAWLRSAAPHTRIIGVQAEQAPAMTRSWRSGRPITTPHATTIADGIATRVPVLEALEMMDGAVDEMVLVGESQIADAQRELAAALPTAIEPSAAAPWAALRAMKASDGAAVIVITGGNVAAVSLPSSIAPLTCRQPVQLTRPLGMVRGACRPGGRAVAC